LGAFRYSDEEGTPSYRSGPVVTPRLSYERFRKVMALGRRISRERNRRLKATRVEVLVEGFADAQGYVRVGRHRGQAPEVDGVTYLVSCQAPLGEIIEARVLKTGAHDLVAEPIQD
jgi:ribosomal protein S12 methylthiotransferase